MKKVTVSVDQETHRLARTRAAELGTSVSALVRGYLRSLVAEGESGRSPLVRDGGTGVEIRRKLLRELFADFDARGVELDMADNLSREELYDRDRARSEVEGAEAYVSPGEGPYRKTTS